MTERDFPADFLWGAATAAHQVEGSQRELRLVGVRTRPAHGGSRVLRRRDRPLPPLSRRTSPSSRRSATTRRGCRWNGRGSSPPRASSALPCSPTTGDVLDALHAEGLTSFVTLHHFTLPAWFAARGGWTRAGCGGHLRAVRAAGAHRPRRSTRLRLHDQRAADGRPARVPRGLSPTGRHESDAVEAGRPRAAGGAPSSGRRDTRADLGEPGTRRATAAARAGSRRRGERRFLRCAAGGDRRPLRRRHPGAVRRRLARRAVLPQELGRPGQPHALRSPACRGADHPDGLGGVSRRPQADAGARRRLRSATLRHRERHRDRRRRRTHRVSRRSSPRRGGGSGRRDRHPRVPALVRLRQLRVVGGISAQVRPHRRRPRERISPAIPSRARTPSSGSPAPA